MPESREILERLPQVDVRSEGGKHGISTTTRKPRLRRSVEPAHHWMLSDVIVITLTLLLAGMVSSLVIGNRLTHLLPAIGVVWLRIVLLVAFYAIELGVLAFLAYRRKLPFAAAYRLRRLTDEELERLPASTRPTQSARPMVLKRAVVVVIAASVGLRFAAYGWTLLATNSLKWALPQSQSMPYLFGRTLSSSILALLIVGVLGPVIEELAYRVIIQEYFAARRAIPLAALITAMIFTVSHISLWAAPLYLILGLTTSWLAYRAKTIWPAFVAHVIYNATIVLAAYYLLLR
jgi:membrane protease YdiL (CAAX protease family)